MLLKSQALEDQYLEFLINPHLKEINLFECSKVNIQLVIDRLHIIGKTITSIDLSYSPVSDAMLKEMTNLLPNIETMYLYNTECTDEVLQCIAHNCPVLKTLDVSDCSKITDKGLMNLCETGKRKNSKLSTLHIEGTEVTSKGIGFILKNMPLLTKLEYEFLPQVIYEMHKNNLKNNSLDRVHKYNLREIDFSLSPVEDLPAIMKTCSVLCPNITSLEVHVPFIEVLLYAEFPRLQELALTFFASPISVDGMDKFLELSGSELLKFDLYKTCICCITLAKFCTKLKALLLRDIKFKPMKGKKMPLHAFSHITEFSITNANLEDQNTSSSVKFILSSSKSIEELTFDNIKALSGEFIDSVLKNNSLASLTTLYLTNSDVNVETVKKFFLADNKLECVCLTQCKNISNTDYENLQSLANTRKLDVNVYWTDYDSDENTSDDCDSDDYNSDTYDSDVY